MLVEILLSYDAQFYINQTRNLQNHFSIISPSWIPKSINITPIFLRNSTIVRIICTLNTIVLKFPIDLRVWVFPKYIFTNHFNLFQNPSRMVKKIYNRERKAILIKQVLTKSLQNNYNIMDSFDYKYQGYNFQLFGRGLKLFVPLPQFSLNSQLN